MMIVQNGLNDKYKNKITRKSFLLIRIYFYVTATNALLKDEDKKNSSF